MSIKKEFIIDHKGKPHVLYAGLLNAAHESGLLSIETAIAQIPSAANGHVAVCTATVRLADSDGVTKTFTGIGDANPGNVSQAMSPHLLRMSETRAKARALRDAINVSEALADDPTEDEAVDQKVQSTNGKARAVTAHEPSEQDREARIRTYYLALCKEAMQKSVAYTPIKQLATLEAVIAEGQALKQRLASQAPVAEAAQQG